MKLFELQLYNSIRFKYGNHENYYLKSRNAYLEFILENGITASPITIHPPPPHPHTPHTYMGGGQGGPQRFFEITVFEKEVSRKAVLRFEKSVFEINDFSLHFEQHVPRCPLVQYRNNNIIWMFQTAS